MALPCLNCNEPVKDEEAKIFAGVFCCPVCFERAERLDRSLQAELKRLFIMTRESIRIALVEGKLHFGDAANSEVPKTELMKQMVRLEEIREKSKGAALGPDGRAIRK